MDLTRLGKKNQNADTLSHNPVDTTVNATVGALATIGGRVPLVETISLDMNTIQSLQQADQFLFLMLEYLKDEKLPLDGKKARRIVLENKYYGLLDSILHHESPTHTGVVEPKGLQKELIEEAHGGLFAGHFSEKKV